MAVLSVALIVAVFCAVAAALSWRDRATVTVWEWQQGLLFQDGRFERTLPPGRYAVGLWAGRPGRVVVGVSTGPRIHAVPLQEVLTADGFSVKLGAVVAWRVADARAHHAATSGAEGQDPIHVAAQLALRTVASARTLDALLAARSEAGALEADMRPTVAPAVASMGGELQQLAIRDVVLPAEIRRMVTEAERARREGLAALERARGEMASLRSLANAARLMRGNPELQTLRTLQALAGGPGRPAPTVVLGVPGALPLPRTGDPEPDA